MGDPNTATRTDTTPLAQLQHFLQRFRLLDREDYLLRDGFAKDHLKAYDQPNFSLDTRSLSAPEQRSSEDQVGGNIPTLNELKRQLAAIQSRFEHFKTETQDMTIRCVGPRFGTLVLGGCTDMGPLKGVCDLLISNEPLEQR